MGRCIVYHSSSLQPSSSSLLCEGITLVIPGSNYKPATLMCLPASLLSTMVYHRLDRNTLAQGSQLSSGVSGASSASVMVSVGSG